jgi:membrane protein DedA with SNARE-associated domain
VRPVGGVVTAAIGSAGMPGLFGLLLAMEAGVPVPVPGDVVMLLVGERVSAGALPLWLAVAALELVAVAGTATLFLLARGPARTLPVRVGRGRMLLEGCCPACLAAGALASARLRTRSESEVVP